MGAGPLESSGMGLSPFSPSPPPGQPCVHLSLWSSPRFPDTDVPGSTCGGGAVRARRVADSAFSLVLTAHP